jgi:hypothetical protein
VSHLSDFLVFIARILATRTRQDGMPRYIKRLPAHDVNGWPNRILAKKENKESLGELKLVAMQAKKDPRLLEDWVDDKLDDYDELLWNRMHWKDK